MPSELMETGAGLQISDPGFRGTGKLVLRILFALSPSLRESVLFGSSRICLTLQKVVQRSLGGPWIARTRFTEGPLRGYWFECWTSEKYLILGARYEHSVQAIVCQMVRKGDVAYDVGAHAGYMSLLLSTLCGPSGHVFAFEPSPTNFHRLKENIELNQKHNTTALNLAASDVEGAVFLLEAGSQSLIVSPGSAPSENCSRIHTVCLDNFVYRDSHAPPTFVKIDVEGHAGRCLAGMKRVLKNVRPRVLCEIHDAREDSEVSKILTQYFYECADVESAGKFPRHIVASPC